MTKSLRIITAALAMLAIGGCASLGQYLSDPAQTFQFARQTFSTALSLYDQVCNAQPNASYCSAQDVMEAHVLEAGAQAAISLAEGVFTSYATGSASSSEIAADVQNAVTAITKFSDFVNGLAAQKNAAMAARAGIALSPTGTHTMTGGAGPMAIGKDRVP